MKWCLTCEVCGKDGPLTDSPYESALEQGWEVVFCYALCPLCSERGLLPPAAEEALEVARERGGR